MTRPKTECLHIWVIYWSPSDMPDLFVAREWWQEGGEPKPSETIFTATTLQGVRDLIPQGLFRMDRAPGDVHAIVETWF
jgi:hypothetical protein